MTEKKYLHSKEFAIRWGDLDAYGHLNNINYFLYIQEARFAMLSDLQISFDSSKEAPILLKTSCNFLKQVFWPETLSIETWLVNVIRKKIYFEHVIKSAKDPSIIYARADALVIWYNFKEKCTIFPPYIDKLLKP